MRIQLTLSLSPSEAEQVVALVKTFKGEASPASSELLSQPEQNQSAPAPDKKSPGRPKKDQSASPANAEAVTIEAIRPLIVEACQKNLAAVEAELKRYGLTKASDANPEQLGHLKLFFEKLVAGPKELPI